MEETKILLENLKADIIKGKENKMNPNYFHERLLNIKAVLKEIKDIWFTILIMLQ